jgi:hypothetical protein
VPRKLPRGHAGCENGDESGTATLIELAACRCANAAADGEISLVAKESAVSGDLLDRNGRGGRAVTTDDECEGAVLIVREDAALPA